MDLNQNFQDYTTECQSEDDATIKQKYNSGLAPITEPESNEGSFECNICFDLAHDPVVTLCGHLEPGRYYVAPPRVGRGNPRIRRQELRVEKSLH